MNEANTVQFLSVVVGILGLAYVFLRISLDRAMKRVDLLISAKEESNVLEYKLEGKAKATVDLSAMKGEHGVVITALRPYGTVCIDGKTFHARTEGGYLHKEAQISVLRSENDELVVCEVESPAAELSGS